MKTPWLITTTCSILVATGICARGQSPSDVVTCVLSTTIIGAQITGPNGEKIGKIRELVLDRASGEMLYVVLTMDGNATGKTVAAPWSLFRPGADPHSYIVPVDRDKISRGPVWDSSEINRYCQTAWINQLYSYYGMALPLGIKLEPGRTNLRPRVRTLPANQPEEPTGPTANPDTLMQPPHPPGTGGVPSKRPGSANARES